MSHQLRHLKHLPFNAQGESGRHRDAETSGEKERGRTQALGDAGGGGSQGRD